MPESHVAAGSANLPSARRAASGLPAPSFLRERLKYAIIRAGLEASALFRTHALLPGLGGRGVIFTLHHVAPTERRRFRPNAGLTVTPGFLEQAVLAARECGLVPVHLHELPALLADPADRRRFVVFTLDDGYRDNAAFAAPVFRRHAVPYTIFLTGGFVERQRTIWWETAAALLERASAIILDFGAGPERVETATLAQKRAAFARLEALVGAIDEDEAVARIDQAARRAGVDPMAIVDQLVMGESEIRALAEDPLAHFGAHTLSHVNLRRVGAERLRCEVEGSARAVARYAGRRARSFAYPYGWARAAGAREAQAVREAGFPVAVTTRPGVLSADCLRQPALLPRVSLNGHFQAKRHVKALISGLPLALARG